MKQRLSVHWLESGDTRGLYQKFCLMESAVREGFAFRVWPRSSWSSFGLEVSDVAFLKEGYSVFRAVSNGRSCLVVLDNKDSFFNISPLIRVADIYFLGAYVPEIIESKRFFEPYCWQTETDLAPYRMHFTKVVDHFGDQFGKIERSIPMPMIMHPPLRTSGSRQSPHRFTLVALALAMDRLARRWQIPLFSSLERAMFATRYKELLALRNQRLAFDIVASDTLWAWPEHRARLYYEISRLPNQDRILTRLSEPYAGASWPERVSPQMLDFVKRKLESAQAEFSGRFERNFAASRLNVLACGKHWGWRQLGFISLLCGTPVLMDKPIFSPYFPMEQFDLCYTRDQWQELPDILASLDEQTWTQTRSNNQRAFDTYLAPHAVGRYMLTTIRNYFDRE